MTAAGVVVLFKALGFGALFGYVMGAVHKALR